MDMHIDETRHDIGALEIDDLVRGIGTVSVGDVGDTVTFHQYRLVCYRLHILCAVKDDAVDKCVFHKVVLLVLLLYYITKIKINQEFKLT